MPCSGDADSDDPGGVTRSGSAGRCDEARAAAEVARRAACAGTGWSEEAATAASARAEAT